MTSKKVGSPLGSLFQQWSSQYQDGSPSTSAIPASSSPSSSYRIVFQTNYSMQSRCQAADNQNHSSNDNIHEEVYRRAGLLTPKETAVRDILGSTAWLEHMADLAISSHCHVVRIQTKANKRKGSLDSSGNNTVIDLSRDPWGWDDTEDETATEEKSSLPPSLADLSKLHDYIQQQAFPKPATTAGTDNSAVVLVWDSLEPLLAVHGFVPTIRFLIKFSSCLQIWPIRTNVLTESQHGMLEDVSQALLQLQGGEMTMIRQGIREPGNIVRERLPFRLVQESNNNGTTTKVLEEEDERKEYKGESTTNTAAEDTATSSAPKNEERGSSNHPASSSSSARPRIQLKMEEDVETTPGGNNASDVANRPRIFLEDDDPEFDDLDEEDPDEDLDI